MKLLKSSLALAALLSAFTATELSAASFSPGEQGKKYSRSDGRAAARQLTAGQGGATLATTYYCAWQNSSGAWQAKEVNMLTVCINSVKVACTDGQCTAE